jgi:hypothetical protein
VSVAQRIDDNLQRVRDPGIDQESPCLGVTLVAQSLGSILSNCTSNTLKGNLNAVKKKGISRFETDKNSFFVHS